MDLNATEEKRITARMLEAHFSGVNILLDYLNALNNPASNRVKKAYWKYIEKVEAGSNTPDSSEAIYGFVAYLLRNQDGVNEQDPKQLKYNLAIMAEKFCKVNALSGPFPGYNNRVKIPSSGADNLMYSGEQPQ